MTKFHITPTGQARECKAQTPESCKYSQEAGEVVAHYDTRAEAQQAYEQQMSQQGEGLSKLKKANAPEFNADDVQEESTEKKYYILDGNEDRAIRAVEAANKKLENAGITERFEYSIEEKVEIINTNGIKKYIPYYELTLSTPSISYNVDGERYEFQAVIEAVGDSYITRSAVELNGWTPKDLTCDHCGQKRSRNKTYIVKAPDGSRKQIGSSCVQAYLGVKPAGLWALGTSPLEKFDDGFDSVYGGSAAHDPEELMALAMAETNEGKNYMSKDRALLEGDNPTSHNIRTILGNTNQAWTKTVLEQAEEYRRKGKAKEIIERLKNLEGDTDYVNNLRTLANSQFIRDKDLSFFVSGVAAIAREDRLKKQAEEREERQRKAIAEFSTGHFGTINEKIERGTEFELYSKSDYADYDFNGNPITKTRVLAKDSEGHQVIWFTTAEIHQEVGEPITLSSGKVKKHSKYNGIDQTVLGNVRLLKKK